MTIHQGNTSPISTVADGLFRLVVDVTQATNTFAKVLDQPLMAALAQTESSLNRAADSAGRAADSSSQLLDHVLLFRKRVDEVVEPNIRHLSHQVDSLGQKLIPEIIKQGVVDPVTAKIDEARMQLEAMIGKTVVGEIQKTSMAAQDSLKAITDMVQDIRSNMQQKEQQVTEMNVRLGEVQQQNEALLRERKALEEEIAQTRAQLDQLSEFSKARELFQGLKEQSASDIGDIVGTLLGTPASVSMFAMKASQQETISIWWTPLSGRIKNAPDIQSATDLETQVLAFIVDNCNRVQGKPIFQLDVPLPGSGFDPEYHQPVRGAEPARGAEIVRTLLPGVRSTNANARKRAIVEVK